MMRRMRISQPAIVAPGWLPQLLLLFFCATWILSASPAHAGHYRSHDLIDYRPPTWANILHNEENPPPDAEEEAGVLPYTFFTGQYRPNNAPVNTALQQICSQDGITTRIVYCIRTIIDGAVNDFLSSFRIALNAFILGLITLAVSMFGAKILLGVVDKPGPEAMTLLLKIGAVLLFTNSLGGFLPMVFPVMEALAGYGMSYIGSGDSSILLQSCSEASGFDGPIWAKVDCILQRLLIGGDGFRVGVLWVLAVAILWTNIFGILIFFVMLSVFAGIVLLVIRCVYVFLASYAFLALLIVISPLLIPLGLFRNTVQYFNKWWRHFLSMMIQPMLLFAYMAFVFAMIDSMFFQDNDYSLSSILGVSWEQPILAGAMTESAINEQMDRFEEETGFKSGDPEYDSRRNYLVNDKHYRGVGNVNLKEGPLIEVEVNAARHLVDAVPIGAVPIMGNYLEDGAGIVADAIDKMISWVTNELGKRLIPFQVTRIEMREGDDGDAPRIMSLMWDLLKFFVVLLVMLPLLIKFTKDIPGIIQRLSSAIRTPGAVMPGEKQVVGTIGAAKGATTGAVRGAVVGFATGGKAGAVHGAVEGGARGAASGYRRATSEYGSRRHGGGLAGNEHQDNVMAKEGGSTQRQVLHGQGGGGGGIVGRGIGVGKSAVTDVAVQAVTRGRGRGGGGGGGGAGGGGAGTVRRR